MLKHGFTRFLDGHGDTLHFAAHSHHFWPDVSFEAQQTAWCDAAKASDQKWNVEIFENIMPAVQRQIADKLSLSDPQSLCFAPNTHEYVLRLLSCFETPVRILTTDSEFHSFSRQMQRLEEEGLVTVTRIPTVPFADFSARFVAAANAADFDMVFFSQVFFNSGFAVTDFEEIANKIENKDCFIVIDGYHGFMARPTDLSAVQARVFYLGGGYKYAMAGEGVCFMHCPADYGLRPVNTGWWAAFGALEAAAQDTVPYGAGANRFMGATFDPTGLYRFHAVQKWLAAEKVDVADIHAHVQKLQHHFVQGLKCSLFCADDLVVPLENTARGNFLTFELAQAGAVHDTLQAQKIQTDYRGNRLRFGFGVYHTEADVDRLLQGVNAL